MPSSSTCADTSSTNIAAAKPQVAGADGGSGFSTVPKNAPLADSAQ